MKVYLFGGAEVQLGQVPEELKLIENVIRASGVSQVLHIPFARPVAHEPEWNGDWYHRYINLDNVEYLNANNKAEIARAKNPLVFISGGSESGLLLNKINEDSRLLDLIKNAKYIIGESAGSKALGGFARVRNAKGEREVVSGLGIVQNCVIEPHYTELKRELVLEETLNKTSVKYGLGIDSMTALVLDPETFPEKYEVIGKGKVEIKKL